MTLLIRLAGLASGAWFVAISASALAAPLNPWDGVWSGNVAKTVPIEVHILDGKVVGYSVEGTPISVKFSDATADAIVFGDRDHYVVKLKAAGAAGLIAKYRDRDGFSRVALNRVEE
ncbi:MAG: hypothetical protein ABR970_19925 [Roseiarcus sp.]|jgi:hypothetical protein